MTMIERMMRLHRLQAPDDTQGGGGGGDTQPGAGGDTQPGAGSDTQPGGGQDTQPGAGGDKGSKEKTLMEELGKGGQDTQPGAGGEGKTPEEKAAAAKLQAAEKDTRRPKDVPAKYWDTEKGEVNHAAWAKSTTELETRMRTVGLPPKEAGEYKFEIPKALKDAGIDLDPAQAKGFKDLAHGLGLTQKQYEGVMAAHFANAEMLADQTKWLSRANAEKNLLEYYKTPEAMTTAVRDAYRVFEAYADEKDMALIDQIGNIPAVVRVLAKIAPEMREDGGLNNDDLLPSESLEHLMRGTIGKEDSPYWNADHPQHKQTVAKVMRHHEAQAKARQRKAA